jgi:Fur family transcriptional regulator, peroxide stress response regulator
MNINMSRLDQMVDVLKENGFRLTPQRIAIVEILANSYEHPGVEQIHREVTKKFSTTSLATVYKTVSLLKELGEVMEIGFGDQINRYDGKNPHPHPHIMCVKCKSIIDPDLSALDALSRELSEETGFKIFSHRLDFFGICPKCQKNQNNN